jgi:hypothetical protein
MDGSMIVSGLAAASGMVASVIGGLVLRNQKLQDERYQTMKEQVENQSLDIKGHTKDIARIDAAIGLCKVDCTQKFVTTEQFVREAGFVRRTMENLMAAINRMEGSLQVMNKMPEIVGQIASSIVKQLKDEG